MNNCNVLKIHDVSFDLLDWLDILIENDHFVIWYRQ